MACTLTDSCHPPTVAPKCPTQKKLSILVWARILKSNPHASVCPGYIVFDTYVAHRIGECDFTCGGCTWQATNYDCMMAPFETKCSKDSSCVACANTIATLKKFSK